MRKVFYLSVLMITLFLVLTGCRSNTDWNDGDAITAEVLNSGAFAEPLNLIEPRIGFDYYDLSQNDFEKAIFYFSSGATAEEYVYLKAKSAEAFAAAQDAANERIEYQLSSFATYLPAEIRKLENAKVYTNKKELIIIICVADDYDKIKL